MTFYLDWYGFQSYWLVLGATLLILMAVAWFLARQERS